MAGTKIGGIKTSIRIKERRGEDFYQVIGAKGGRKSKLDKLPPRTKAGQWKRTKRGVRKLPARPR